jgi:DNA-binding transcriptional LysR family regulator
MALVREEIGVAIVPSPLTKMCKQNVCVKEISSQYIPWKIGIVTKKNRYKPHALQALLRVVSDVYSKDD